MKKDGLLGFVIGKYGVDVLATSGVIKGVHAFKELKYHNASLTFETCARSPKNKEVILEKATQKTKVRITFFKNDCYLHMGQQNKHIRGAKSFVPEEKRGELIISVEKLKELATSHHGKGIVHVGTFGETGYREHVDFGEIIGIHFPRFPHGKETSIRTSVEEIHYKADGGYHVIPVHPKRIKGKPVKNG